MDLVLRIQIENLATLGRRRSLAVGNFVEIELLELDNTIGFIDS